MRQKQKIGADGSLINQIMGNNETLPKIGEWVTIMHYTDRSVAKVVEVSKDGKSCLIEHYGAKAAAGSKGGIGHQDWQFYPEGGHTELRWRNGAWRATGEEFVFTDEFIKEANSRGVFALARALTQEQRDDIYQGDIRPQKAVEGITKKVRTYHKMNVIFGVCSYYYDWSF